jgi:hypothetical protein
MTSTSKKQVRSDRARVVAEMRAAEARAERRRRLVLAGAVVAAVAIVVVALVSIGLSSGNKSGTAKASSTASAAVLKDIAGVPAATFDTVGAGTTTGGITKISAPALTQDGKPRVLYVGAEYCPYCAAQRWPLTVALARFGTWGKLGQTESASQDDFPNTPTLSYHGASYRSDYLSFTGVETTTNKPTGSGYQPLDTLSATDQKLFDTYNKPPYVKGQGGAIPFADLGGRYVSSGASYTPQLLAGKSHAQIAAALKDPSSPVAKAVDGTANVYTAALCTLTGNKPGNVCTSTGVTKVASKLTGG